MQLLIDNLDGRGAQDLSALVDSATDITVVRKLNCPAALNLSLIPTQSTFVAPTNGARVSLGCTDGLSLFTGYLTADPCRTYVGQGDHGPVYRYDLQALSDAMLLDQKTVELVPAFVARNGGDAFRQLTQDVLPGWFDLTGIEAGDPVPYFEANPSKKWSVTAAQIGLAARCSYRDNAGKLILTALGRNTYPLAESDSTFSPDGLRLQNVNRMANDVTVLGEPEPAAHVKDYFVGDGTTTTFYLSQIPFTRTNESSVSNRTILDEEYSELDLTHWTVIDPQHAISASAGQLQVAGGAGTDGQTCLNFIETIELGGATILEHGDVVFTSSSDGVIGGLYGEAVSIAGCMAGFRITPSGTNSNIQALLGGALSGATMATQPGHHYVLTTRIYPTEIYRMEQVYHSSLHAGGNWRGGQAVGCDVRLVLEVHDIDPSNPATQVAPATVLCDGVISNAPGFCTYALINATNMQCQVAFTYLYLAIDALVRTTLPQQGPVTARVGSLLEGAQCEVSTSSSLEFYPEYAPAANQTIEVTYRSRGIAMARVQNGASIAALQNGADDGERGCVRHIGAPVPRASADCENAALALLDGAGTGWSGEYESWGQFLPGGAVDIFPGDGLAVNIPSRAASFLAIVREAQITVVDLGSETTRYALRFVDAGEPALDFSFASGTVKQTQALVPIDVTQVGNTCLADLVDAEITNVTSTTVTIDAGFSPSPGGGIEVRYSDSGWGADNNRNLLGRFTVSSFTLPRYARGQNYFLRSYDGSSPAKYSRYSAALHVDFPLDYTYGT